MYELILTDNELATLKQSRYNASEIYDILTQCAFILDEGETEFSIPRRLALDIVELGAKEDYTWPSCGDKLTHKLNSFCGIFFT